MAAVTDVRSAAEAHHDKEQCTKEQKRKKTTHCAIPGRTAIAAKYAPAALCIHYVEILMASVP